MTTIDLEDPWAMDGFLVPGTAPEPGTAQAHPALRHLKTGDWLDSQNFPSLAWVVPGVIPEGFGLLIGAPKIGKSWVTLDTCLAVASGGRAFGAINTGQPRPVLLLALEDGDRRLQARARKLLHGKPIPSNLHYLTAATPAEVVEVIETWLNIYGDQQPLVVLDTLGKVMPPAMPGEGAYQRDYRIGGTLKALADAHPGAGLLVVHHTRKAASDDWMDSTSGTNGLNGSADYTVALTRARSDNSGTIKVTGRDVPEGEYALTIGDGEWRLDGASLTDAAHVAQAARAAEGLGDQSARIVAHVSTQPNGVRAKTVSEALEITEHTARTYLARAADAGRINNPTRGLYTPVATVASVAFEEQEQDNATLATHATPGPSTCSICNGPMTDTGEGHTTHPSCEAPARNRRPA